MQMKKILIFAVLALVSLQAAAQVEYKASRFGIKSNGLIDNTTSIQKAVDWIAEQGGGTLVFNVGRYLTGSIQLRSGVNIRLNEGAVIVGAANIYAYKGQKGIFWGEGLENVTIFGKGVIDGQVLVGLTAEAVGSKILSHFYITSLV